MNNELEAILNKSVLKNNKILERALNNRIKEDRIIKIISKEIVDKIVTTLSKVKNKKR